MITYVFPFLQLSKEFKKGCAFDGWSEGTLNFPLTYKYEVNSEKYCGEDPKSGRPNPAWYVATIIVSYRALVDVHCLVFVCIA